MIVENSLAQIAAAASPVLGQPGTPFSLFVGVRPIDPGGGSVFPQFPSVSVDPVTGEWQAEAQIGSMESQAQPGNTFQVLTFVTDAELEPMIDNFFDRPVDIPGVVHISRFINLVVGPR